MSKELHPTKTARFGSIPSSAVTRGVNADVGAFSASKEVWCRQCGFRCNLERDARNIDEFAGEAIGKGFNITDHDYDAPGEDHDYDGSGRTTSSLSEDLSNGSFEDWTAESPDDWTVAGTVTQNSTSGYYDNDDGVSSCEATRAGSDIFLSQAASTPSNFNDNNIIFRARVKCSTNGVIRLRLDVNGVSYYSYYNIAQQRYQELSINLKCPVTVSTLTVYILADSEDGTAYVDSCKLTRDSNPTTSTVTAGCPMCGSYNYY